MTTPEQPSEATLTFNDVLTRSGIDLKHTLVFRHRPYEPKLNRIFEWIAAERPDLYDCYQSTQSLRVEGALRKAKHVASFLRHTTGTAIFVALHEVRDWRSLSRDECVARPAHQELMNLGMVGFKSTEDRADVLEFSLPALDWHADWKGRLIVDWPPPDRSWWRWADRNMFDVEALTVESQFARNMPVWDELVLSWYELSALPSSWEAALRQWRGVYLITDTSDGSHYVGSAYGDENIMQRWREYARTGHGGNKHLRERDPHTFRFAILQRLSPDLPDADVIRAEASWKERLSTRWPNGLNDN